ncbi:hypothetical protein KTH93_04445 [Acinetobacter bereziniae]|uniref:hypothetical protein n=1 Tax=Acinetobacter bereziniae TaxID=106648 RepID=UPI0021CEA25A|nr:hypothetical protein [Acinetobacter bereziniae]MCU4434726.1 hypothetical protein [Acinetobacter bereziniae]
MNIAYVVAECRPSSEEDGYADIVFDDQTYIFESVEPAENIQAAMLITIDIERARPKHKSIVLHHQSLLKLIEGIEGKTISYET